MASPEAMTERVRPPTTKNAPQRISSLCAAGTYEEDSPRCKRLPDYEAKPKPLIAFLFLIRAAGKIQKTRRSHRKRLSEPFTRWKSRPVQIRFIDRECFASPPKKGTCFLGISPRKLPFWESWRSRMKTPAPRVRRHLYAEMSAWVLPWMYWISTGC